MTDPSKYMKRCCELAALGLGHTAPNPVVGCVVVHQDRIIGEGYHREYGKAHAEVNAVNSVQDKSMLRDSTLFVSLEPCSHFGKTPPCADFILDHGIPRVVVGCVDTFREVSGRGISRLREAGVEVTVGLLEGECREVNRRFFTYHGNKRPYVLLKWAQSADGYISRQAGVPLPPEQRKISNNVSQMLVHRWRTEEQAILAGTRTALLDNPMLTARHWKGKNPLRCVIDKDGKLPSHLHLLDGSVPTLVFTALSRASSGNTEYVQLDMSRNMLPQLLTVLYERSVQSVLVEGGSMLLKSFIDSGLWDEARVFTSPERFGSGTAAPAFTGTLLSTQPVAGDTLSIYRNAPGL
jgi:diaminohydroxyphosphoribosylaminopyrimidine deaminase / 5-amino-6-(5-phosphoribosylamino)uracil reductase